LWDDGRGVVIFQGTIAPDRIESGKTGGAVIKRHHNTGLNFGNLAEVTPLQDLFKDEVRALAKVAGLPARVYTRMPFPGPGTFLRGVRDQESSEVVTWADARVRELCKADPRYADIDQLYACNLGRAPGVKGDGPVKGYIIGIRGVRTTRYMTVEGVAFEPDMQLKIDKALTEGHKLIVFTAYIPTPKSPGMVEIK
jgi:GMP synthase (glutamine-hydrolysing)